MTDSAKAAFWYEYDIIHENGRMVMITRGFDLCVQGDNLFECIERMNNTIMAELRVATHVDYFNKE